MLAHTGPALWFHLWFEQESFRAQALCRGFARGWTLWRWSVGCVLVSFRGPRVRCLDPWTAFRFRRFSRRGCLFSSGGRFFLRELAVCREERL